MFKPCIIIPVYNHEHAIASVLHGVLQHHVPCILVNDGSSAICRTTLEELAKTYPDQVSLIHHAHNQGKGAAVLTGFNYAHHAGYTHALQIDADGQHAIHDIPIFLKEAQEYPTHIILGHPIYDDSVPKLRLYGRYLTHLCVWLNTLSFDIVDSMCGFRVYPLDKVITLMARCRMGSRMNFDTDIIVRLYWEGANVRNIGTRVAYPIDGVSHFRMFKDNALMTRMHITHCLGMLWRSPKLIARHFTKANH